jgi:hypothetical protein
MTKKSVSRPSGRTCDKYSCTRPEIGHEAKELSPCTQSDVRAIKLGFNYDRRLIDTWITTLHASPCRLHSFNYGNVCFMTHTR